MPNVHDVDDEPIVAHPGDHSPVAQSVSPIAGPSTGQRLAELARISRSEEPVVNESLYSPLNRPIQREEFVPRRGMKLNAPGQAAS